MLLGMKEVGNMHLRDTKDENIMNNLLLEEFLELELLDDNKGTCLQEKLCLCKILLLFKQHFENFTPPRMFRFFF